jgi:hypothetical protein
MTTKIYGASDDLIEFDGDVDDEVSALAVIDPRKVVNPPDRPASL